MVEKHRAKLEALHAARLEGYRKQAEDIGRLSVTIEANANEEGHLYGSVGTHEIASALKAQGVAITADQIRLDGPLKELALLHGEGPPAPGRRRRTEGVGRADGR